jgi:adhesin transport system membrane fusion protein
MSDTDDKAHTPGAALAGFLVDQLEGGIGGQEASRTPRLIVYACCAFVVLFLGWAALASVDRVVRAPGRVIPSTQANTIQHLEGGVVAEIFVREGEKVKVGQPLVSISDVLFDADREQQVARIDGLRARIARLRAEAGGVVNPDLGAGELANNERMAFRARQDRLQQTLNVLRAQAAQKNAEIAEIETRQRGLEAEMKVAREQLSVVSGLIRKNAASQLELLEAQGRLERLTTQISEAQATVPRLRAALGELLEKEKDALAQFRSESRTALAEAESEAARLAPELRKGDDRVSRTVLKAPVDGVVNRLYATTIGGVVKPGETVLELTPEGAVRTVEAMVNPADRAELRPGLPAVVKLTAFDFTIFGTLTGKVTEISADTVSNDKGERYFRVRVAVDNDSLQRFGHEVTPGLIANTDIVVGQRTVMEYLVSPIRRMQSQALREWK